MSQEERFDELFQSLMDYEQETHQKNQKRIRIGIRCLIWIPLCFLLLLFMTESSKMVFLTLWIVSLFVIAVYLIWVEYSDFQMQQRITEISKREEETEQSLIGEELAEVEQAVLTSIDEMEELKRERKLQRLQAKQERKELKAQKRLEKKQRKESKRNAIEEREFQEAYGIENAHSDVDEKAQKKLEKKQKAEEKKQERKNLKAEKKERKKAQKAARQASKSVGLDAIETKQEDKRGAADEDNI